VHAGTGNVRRPLTSVNPPLPSRSPVRNVGRAIRPPPTAGTVHLNSPYPNIEIPSVTFTDYLFEKAAQWPERTAIVCAASGRSYTYLQMVGGIRRAAAGLHARGIRKGDVVALVSANLPEFPIAFHAVLSLGAICTTLNPLGTVDELAQQFADADAKLLITIPQLLEKVAPAVARVPSIRETIVFGEAPGATPFMALMADAPAPPKVEIDPARDVAALPFSSGTSGTPKGVMLTHRNLVANVAQFTDPQPLAGPDDVVLGILPFFHIYGLVVILGGSFREGVKVVSMPRFELEPLLQAMQDHKVSIAMLVPPLVLAFAKHPVIAKYDLSAMHTIFSGAAPLGPGLADAVRQRFPAVRLRQGYGLTEASPTTHFHPLRHERDEPDAVGPAVPNTECRLVDPETGKDVGAGERGELWVRGPQVMLGYRNNPTATAECLTPDGWLKTGDVATADAAAWFRIVDRVKELIKYKGQSIAPAELEAVLLGHPAIADAAVIPSPDEEAGEIPKAFVVLRAPLSAEEVMAYVAKRVAAFKRVRAVEFVESVPRSVSGKILRRVLVERERAARG
jgi:acyl-CoA synthetase (AMP-forming)/AMP-acid ligase II